MKAKYDQLIEENIELSQENSILTAKARAQGNSEIIKELQEKIERLEAEKQYLRSELERAKKKAGDRKKNLKQLFELLNTNEKNAGNAAEAILFDVSKGKVLKQIEEQVSAKEREIQARMHEIELMLKRKEEELNELHRAIEKINLQANATLYTQKELDKLLASKFAFTVQEVM